MFALDLDTPVYVNPHKQYGVIRKVIKQQKTKSAEEQKSEVLNSQNSVQYEVRLSNSLENVLVSPLDLKRIITVSVRIHTFKGQEAQSINVKVKVDSTILQLLQYLAQIAQVAPNFINIYHKTRRLGNSDQLYKENVVDGDKLLCV